MHNADDISASPFLADILSQPEALRELLSHVDESRSDGGPIALASHDRVLFTGMGASLASLEPSWLRLAAAGQPAWLLDSARLDQDAPGLLTSKTLVIAASQSGRSAELLSLAERAGGVGATIVSLTNDPQSPFAVLSDETIAIHAGEENAVSTRTYLNTLAAAALLVDGLLGEDSTLALGLAADAIESFLEDWRGWVDAARQDLGLPPRLFLLARGTSLAAAEYGALILKEAAKWPAEAMVSGQFRHGPLELADERLAAIVFAGENPAERERNVRLAEDLHRFGAKAFLADPGGGPGTLTVPRATGRGAPLGEAILPQLLAIALAETQEIEPGAFRHLGKITTVE